MVPPDKAPLDYKRFIQEINASLSREYDGDGELSKVLPVAEFKTFESENARLSIQEYEKIIKMRGEWSNLFKIVVRAILVFEITLTILVGLGWLKFQDEWFLRIIIIGGFAQLLT